MPVDIVLSTYQSYIYSKNMSLKSKIRDILLKVFPGHMLRYHINATNLNYKIWGNLNFREELDRNLKLFLSDEELSNNEVLKKIEEDVLLSYWKFGSIPNEYFMFGFKDMLMDKRKEFLTLSQKDKICISVMGSSWREKFLEIRDKGKFYDLARQYFRRDACVIRGTDDIETYSDFISRHSCFIAKPNAGMCGRDTFIVELDANPEKAEELFNDFSKSGISWILEELIIQDSWASKWNESSVNTVRVPSFITSGGRHEILQPFFRTGRKGQVVDNGGAGGVFAVVDEKTGMIITDGRDEMGRTYKMHPDSSMMFKGAQIPDWNGCVKLSEEIHRSMPDYHRYLAFDFAMSKDGWVLVEANWGQFLGQYTLKIGVRRRFEELMLG